MKKMILLLLLAALLCGCTQPGGREAHSAEVTTASEGETPAVTTVPEETTAPTEETVVLEAVNPHGFRSSKEKPAVAVLDCRTAAFLTTEYPDKNYTRKCTRVQVVDLYTDAVKAETLLEGTYTPVFYCAAPGNLALVNPETRDVTVLDGLLREVLTFRAEDPEGILSADLENYYFIWGSQLYSQSTATGESGPMDTEYAVSFHELLGYDAGENILLATVYAGTYTADLCVGAVDLDTGKLAVLYRDVTGGAMAARGVLLERENLEELCSDVYYCDWTDGELRCLPGLLVNNLNYAVWHISGTDYVCRITYDKVQSVNIEEFELLRLGETVSACSVQEELKGAKISQMYALPDGNLLALETTGRGYRPYLICPALLEFTDTQTETTAGAARVDTELAESLSRIVSWELPQELEQVRLMADELETEYGITILLSGQCTEALEATEMTIVTTDLAQLPDEAGAIKTALEELEKVLERYPADFFRQFRNEAGERGLLVLLVEDFESDINIIGLSYGMGQWYPVAVDITSGRVSHTYCHEIWHATENRIQDLNKTALDLEAWENCNPVGFQYSGNMTNSYIEDTQYTYFMGRHEEGVYFVDPYAKTKPQEDRARLMEYVMCSEADARMMLEFPVMRAKLLILCNAIRQTFDTEQWGNVHWERFF